MEKTVVTFEPQTVRTEVVKQMEQMQASKFVKLPENYKESAFFAIEKLSGLEEIEKVQSIDITKALIKIFSNKLDFQKNHCYFFVQNDKNSPTGKSLRFGWQYQGLMFVSKRECNVYGTTPCLVYENDVFETHYEYGALIIDKHVPSFEGIIKGGYCVVDFQDKQRLVKYYTKSELDKRRDKSMAKSGKFWAWEREMYEKTLINAVLKRIIETSSDVEASNLYDEPDSPRQAIEAEIILQNEPKAIIEQSESNEVKQELFESKPQKVKI